MLPCDTACAEALHLMEEVCDHFPFLVVFIPHFCHPLKIRSFMPYSKKILDRKLIKALIYNITVAIIGLKDLCAPLELSFKIMVFPVSS